MSSHSASPQTIPQSLRQLLSTQAITHFQSGPFNMGSFAVSRYLCRTLYAVTVGRGAIFLVNAFPRECFVNGVHNKLPRGYSSELSVGVCRPVPQILILVQTKTCHFPHPFSDLAVKIHTRFQTFVVSSKEDRIGKIQLE